MKDGIINLDTARGRVFGFSSDKFVKEPFASYLWKTGNYVYISWIETIQHGKGYLSALFAAILEEGLGIKIPTPLGRMRKIVKARGFTETIETEIQTYQGQAFEEPVEVWVKEPSTCSQEPKVR